MVMRRLLFILTGVALLSQSFVLWVADEPYPFIRMPAFWGTGGYKDNKIDSIKVDFLLIGEDEDVVVSSDKMLSDFDVSRRPTLAKLCFSPRFGKIWNEVISSRRSLRSPRIEWLKEWFSGYYYAFRNGEDPIVQQSRNEWLKHRIRELYPSLNVSCVVVRWHRVTTVWSVGRSDVTSEIVETLDISLGV